MITQSPFLQALGYAILNSLWQFALLWLMYIVISGLTKPAAQYRYRMALLFQLAGFLWFVFTFQYYVVHCQEAVANTAALGKLQLSSQYFAVQQGWMKYLLYAEQLLPYLATAYLLVLFFLLVKWWHAYRYTKQIRRQGLQKIEVDWRLFTQKMAALLGIKPQVKIYLSELVNSPLTIGFLKPIILIPAASVNHLSVAQLEAVILHELAHIRRMDYIMNLVLSVVEMLLFFNPFTQLLSKQIKKERELACDDWVLQFQYDGAMYAEALLRLATVQQASFSLQVANKKQDLLLRVRRVIGQPDQYFSYRQQLMALLMMTCILSAITWMSPVNIQTQVKSVAYQTTPKRVVQPVVAFIENPFFNPVFFLKNDEWKQMKTDFNATTVTALQQQQIVQEAIVEKNLQEDLSLAENQQAILAKNEAVFFQFNDLAPALDSAAMQKFAALQQLGVVRKIDGEGYTFSLKQATAELAKQVNVQFARFGNDKLVQETLAKSKQTAAFVQQQEQLSKALEKVFQGKARKMKLLSDSVAQLHKKLVFAPAQPTEPPAHSPSFGYHFAGEESIPVPVFSFETREDVGIRNKTIQYKRQSEAGTEEKIEVIINTKPAQKDTVIKKRIIIFL
jgi:beta-lactamase regulating signal transducer with metallopeptidase domain